MVIQLLTADTIGGINQFWKVIESENPFFIGREISFQTFKDKRYVGWIGSKKKDIYNSWDDFKEANKIKNISYKRVVIITALEKFDKAFLLLERVYEQATLNGKVTVEIYKDIANFFDEIYESENK